MKRKFSKMHGLGNDFVVFDATTQPLSLSQATAQHIADRHFGIGCDQILLVEAPAQDDVDFCYRIFNADGTEVSQCGNGARCFARFVRERGLTDKREIRVQTHSGLLSLQVLEDAQVRVNMGVPQLQPQDIPLQAAARQLDYSAQLGDETLHFSAVSMGNPHAVIRVADVAQAAVQAQGAGLQALPLFPESVNVGFLQILTPAAAWLRVFERGSGETLACGSGACAAMVAGVLHGWLEPQAAIQLTGGKLQLEWQGEGAPVYMTGPAATVFEGEIDL